MATTKKAASKKIVKKATATKAVKKVEKSSPEKKTTETKEVKKAVAKTTAKSTVSKEIAFKFLNKQASTVSLVGDFNGWDPKKNIMKPVKKGEFATKIKIKPGRYTFKYLSDKGWYTDPKLASVYDSMGNQNSVLEVG